MNGDKKTAARSVLCFRNLRERRDATEDGPCSHGLICRPTALLCKGAHQMFFWRNGSLVRARKI